MVTREKVAPSGPDEFRGARERDLGFVIALSADDAWLAVQGARGSVTVWDMHKRELLLALPEERGDNWGLAWSPNCEQLATSFSDGSLVLWNIPRVRARLAELGLDWQDSATPAAPPEPAGAMNWPPPVETARLFALDLEGTAQATLVTEGNVCRVDVTAVDGDNRHAVLLQGFDDLQESATYTVRFRAKADVPRSVVLYGRIDQPSGKSIGLNQVVPLTEDWQAYHYEFQAKDLAASNMIQFRLGERTGTVWVADFTLTKDGK